VISQQKFVCACLSAKYESLPGLDQQKQHWRRAQKLTESMRMMESLCSPTGEACGKESSNGLPVRLSMSLDTR